MFISRGTGKSSLHRRSLIIGAVVLICLVLGNGTIVGSTPKPVKIGVIVPLSGPLASLGEYMLQGVEFIIDRVNGEGGIKSLGGAQIVPVVADSRGMNDVGASEAERLIVREKVVALLASQPFTIQAIAEKYRIPLVVLLTHADVLTEGGYKYTFRPHGKASMDQKLQIDFLIDMGKATGIEAETIAIVCEMTETCQLSAEHLRQFIKDANKNRGTQFRIVYDEPHPSGVTDFTPMILKLKAAKPDVILLVASSVPDVTLLAKSMAAQRYAPRIGVFSFGGATLNPALIPAAGDAVEGWFTIQGWSKGLLKQQPSWAQEMFDGYLRRYGKELTGDVCKVFLDTYTLIYGIEAAGSYDPQKIRDAIANLDIREGPALMVATTPRVKFGPDGQNPYYSTGVAQIRNGEYIMVWPSHAADPGYRVAWPAPPPWSDRR